MKITAEFMRKVADNLNADKLSTAGYWICNTAGRLNSASYSGVDHLLTEAGCHCSGSLCATAESGDEHTRWCPDYESQSQNIRFMLCEFIALMLEDEEIAEAMEQL